tara:strand:- start:35 stop:271 length:237 start_codon:yes stop_codon:yes gene_type:complete
MSTENDLLEITKDFKNRMKSKNCEIADYKKLLAVLYGLIKIADENEDINLLGLARMILSSKLNELLNIDENDLADEDE